jgi:hypothetical protein
MLQYIYNYDGVFKGVFKLKQFMIEDRWNMGKLGLFSNNLHAANRLIIHQEELQYLRNLTELHK